MGEPTTSEVSVEAIWREFGGSLRTFVRRRVGDADTADDIVGDILVRVHTHIDQLQDPERSVAWLFRIARNAITDHYRRSARRPEELDPDPQPADAVEAADRWIDGPDDVLAELAMCIRPLVQALPADYRRAIELTDLDGRTQAEAAELEHLSVSGMKSRVQRGRRQFAQILDQCCVLTLDAAGGLVDFQPRADGACTPEGCAPDCGTDQPTGGLRPGIAGPVAGR
jgi:RNA polymerase sigma-70 factor (ECF subfamily)